MGPPSPGYRPKSPAQSALYQVVRDHFETFRAEAARAHEREGLPRFVEEEFRGFLRCGFLAGGFARFRCGSCGLDRLVPFSCKGRAACPSCGGRRMAERAAHLVDHVFPEVPVRQWVLSLPHQLRYVLAWDHELCRAVAGVFVRAVLGSLRRRARRAGVPGGTGGAVAIIQRFGAALNLNVHVHALTWGQSSTDEMGALWVEVIPRRSEDAALLTQDYFRRALTADIASAELQVRNNPKDPAVHNRLALKYVQAGRIPDAQARLDESLRLAPNDAEAHSNLGTVLQMQGQLSEATPHLSTALKLKPNDDRIRFNYANGLTAAGRSSEAIREYERAIAINPENADAHFNLAMLLGPQKRLDEAVAHLRRVIELTPRNSEAYRNLSVAYGLQGKLDEAIVEARTALRIQPDSAAARQHLDRLLAMRGGR